MSKQFKIMAIFFLCIGILIGCSKTDSNSNKFSDIKDMPEKLPIATIDIENFGSMEVELYPHKAPNTVNNFISLANSGFYDGLTFHRIIEGFMAQGGDPNGTGTGGPGYQIVGEFKNNGFEANDIKHEKGIISMARSRDNDTAGSQFFIMTEVAPHLDGDYAAFGKVIEGMDVVDKLNVVETGSNDKPLEAVVIKSIRVDTQGVEYDSPQKVK